MENSLNMSTDEGLRKFLLGVYNQMGIGVLITGLVAYYVGPDFMTSLGFGMQMVVIFSPLALVFALGFILDKVSPFVATLIFYGLAAIMGLSLSVIFAVYTSLSIVKILLISTSVFASASIYGYLTTKDLTSWFMFLFIGLIGIIIAGIVNIFLGSGLIAFLASAAGVIIFTGFTAYDVQRLKVEYINDPDSANKSSIFGALSLYLNFINLFISLLQLFGTKK